MTFFKNQTIDTRENSSSTLLWSEILKDNRCTDMIAQIYNFSVAEMRRLKKLFVRLISESIRLNGIKWTCLQLKTVEKSILLDRPCFIAIPKLRKFLRFSTNYKITLTFLSIHRNMNVKPKLDLITIKRKLKIETINRILEMEEELKQVLSHRFFAIETFGRIFYKKDI